MECDCMSWVQHLWHQLVSSPWRCNPNQINTIYLPDDLIIEILSRLSVDEVWKFRRVCKKWCTLASSHQFTQKYNASPIILFQCGRIKNKLELYSLDHEKLNGKIKIERVCTSFMDHTQKLCPVLFDSCDGLLVFKPVREVSSKWFICNPVTQEIVTIIKPHLGSQVFRLTFHWFVGIFFHSPTQEYRLLFGEGICGSTNYEYFIHSLGSKVWRRVGTFIGGSYFLPSVISKKSLHWLAKRHTVTCNDRIVIFNPDLENFKTLPHPGGQCGSNLCGDRMLLIKTEMDGISLGIVDHSFLVIWELEDHEKWSWSRKVEIPLNIMDRFGDLLLFRIGEYVGNIRNNELLLIGHMGGVFRYHLQTGAIRKLQRKYPCESKFISNVYTYLDLPVCSYTKSLVSLKAVYGV